MALRGFIVAGCGVQDVVILPRAGEAEVFRGAHNRPQLPVTLWRSQATMCRSPAVRAPGDGERRLLHPANWKYRPRPGIRTSPKPPLSTGVFCEFRCHEAAVRDLTTPATTGRWRFAQNFSGWPPLDDRFTAANLDPALAQPGHLRSVSARTRKETPAICIRYA